MKKLCKILFLALVFSLIISVSAYATEGDELPTPTAGDSSSSEGSSDDEQITPTPSPDDGNTDNDSKDEGELTPGGSPTGDSDNTSPGESTGDGSDTDPDDDTSGDGSGTNTDDDTSGDGSGTDTDDDTSGDGSSTNTDEQEPSDDNNSQTPINGEKFETEDSATKIKATADAGVIKNGAILKVQNITEGTVFNAIKATLGEVKFTLFDITLSADNTTVQPENGTVKLSIPIPDGYDVANLIAYRLSDNGSIEKEYTVKVDGSYAIIEADHFSNYVLAEKATDNTDDSVTKTDTKLDSEPKTGINNPVSFVITVLVVAICGLAICIKKISK